MSQMKEQTRSELIKIASEMVRMIGMPSEELDEYKFPNTVSKKLKWEIKKAATLACWMSRNWGNRIIAAIESDKDE